jgi:dihydroneopterin aldolase
MNLHFNRVYWLGMNTHSRLQWVNFLKMLMMKTRRIIFSRIRLDAYIGILEHERLARQPIDIDAEIDVDVTQNVDDNDIQTVLDYRLLHDAIVQECTRGHVNLLETLTEQVAKRLLALFAETRSVKVRITKTAAFPESLGVAIEVLVHR